MSDAYSSLINKANTLQSSGTYQPYTGGFTSDQKAAFSNIADLGGSSSPYFAAANQNYANGVVPTYQTVGNFMNPYVSNVVNATMANMNELNGQQQQQVIGDAIAKGAYGGNRVGVAQSELARQQNLANQQTIAGLYQDAYNNGLGAAQNQQQVDLTAGAGLGNLGNTAMSTNLAQAAAQLGAGTQQQQFNYQQYLNQQGYPYQQLSWLSGIINGTNNVGSTSTTTQPAGNIFSQLFGLGLGAASLFNRGGRVHRDAGGVIPYGLQSPFMQGDSSWGGYLSGDVPYANDNAIYLAYVPTTKPHQGNRDFPTPPSANDNNDPTGLGSYLTELADLNALKGRAMGGVVPRRHYASGGTSAQDIYSGLIMPQGGIYTPSPTPVMLPPQGMGGGVNAPAMSAAATSAPSSLYDVGNDPNYPISSAWQGGWGSQATGSVGLGLTPDASGTGRLPPYTPSPTVTAYTYDNGQMNPLQPSTAATRAIAANTNSLPTGADTSNGLTWEQSNPGTYAGGDPWAGQRIGGNNYGSTAPGLYTGQQAQAIGNGGGHVGLLGGLLGLNGGRTGLDRIFGLNGGSGLFGGGTLLGNFINGLGGNGGGGAGSNTPAPGTSFLNARGVNTTNQTAGQVQNELEQQLGGAHHGSFGVATGGRVGFASGGSPANDNSDSDPFGSVPDNTGFDPTQYGNTQGVVPYTTGTQFMTDPQPGYSQNIEDALTSLSEGKGLNLSPDVKQSLLAAGAGMMASKSPFALQGIGQGVLAGIDTWNQRQALERENAKARASISQSGQDLAREAAGTAANIGLTGAQTGATRYTFIRTPAGVMVTDAQNPSAPPQFTPWGGVLPNGGRAPASPQDAAAQGIPEAAPGTLFNVQPKQVMDPRLMSPDVAPVVLTETTQKNTAAYDQYKQSAAANEQLGELEHSLSQLPDTGWLTQGPGFDQRLDLAKNINTLSAMAGGQPIIPTDEVAAGEDANKVTTRLGYNLSQTLGSGEAASIVMQSINAVPGAYNSRAGAERLIGAIRAVNQRNMDYYNGLQQWEAANNGSTYGFDQYFNASNPPELYALSAYVPRQALQMLKANPSLAPYFDKKYGFGHNVSQYVIGGQ